MRKFQLGFVGFAVLVSGLLISAQPPQAPASGQGPVAQPAPAGRQGGARGGGRGRGPQVRIRKTLLAWADTRNGQSQHAFTSHALAIVALRLVVTDRGRLAIDKCCRGACRRQAPL